MKIRRSLKKRMERRAAAHRLLYAIGVDVQASAVSVMVTQGRRAATMVLRTGALDQFAQLVNEAVATCRRSQ